MSEYLKKRQAFINAGRPLPEKKKHTPIAKKSEKRLAKEKEQKEAGSDNEMDKFFDAMLKRCKGKCLFCNAPTNDIKLYKIENEKWSREANEKAWEREAEKMKRIAIAHLLPKRPVDKGGFPSVATNENNWIELCWPCHTSFDSGKISWLFLKDSKEWDIISEKLLEVLPAVAEEERKNKLYDQLINLVYSK
jgi:hypothetical protein